MKRLEVAAHRCGGYVEVAREVRRRRCAALGERLQDGSEALGALRSRQPGRWRRAEARREAAGVRGQKLVDHGVDLVEAQARGGVRDRASRRGEPADVAVERARAR